MAIIKLPLSQVMRPTRFLRAFIFCSALVGFSFGQESTNSVPASGDSKKTKTFIDYFLPIPISSALSKKAWGAAEVGPRDQQNGLEDVSLKEWVYWDGQILKGLDNRFHMFASRWSQARGHLAWVDSHAIHAVSDNLFGPFEDKGMCWPNSSEGKGHNVTALLLPDGRYATIISATRPATAFIAKSPEGPWEEGKMDPQHALGANISVIIRPDGDFMIVRHSGALFISKASDGIRGPYQHVGSAYPKDIPDLEDPCLFYSGGLYHIVVNSWSKRKAFHLTSKDGKSNWINRGLAYDPTTDFIRYTDGTVNHWHKIERPSVYMENGIVKAMTFAVVDIAKEQQKGNDGHGSKIIVIPFDGEALVRDLQRN